MDTQDLVFAAQKMSESDKRVLVAIFIVVLLVVLIFGYLQKLVGFIMHNQGLQIDTMMYDIIRTRVITTKKEFKQEAYRKSEILFLKKAWPSFLCMGVFVGILYIYAYAINDLQLNFFVKAANDLSMKLDWHLGKFFNMTIPIDWPTFTKTPDWSWSTDKYMSLFLMVGFGVSAIVFLVYCQAFCSRSMRVRQLCRTYFAKDLNKMTNDHA